MRGYTVMSGYWGNEEATAEAIDDDGWLHTGDIGVMDEAGNVTITDRLKDMYVVGGFNAYPAEIEALLRNHDGVAPSRSSAFPTSAWARSAVPMSCRRRRGRSPRSWAIDSQLVPGAMANYKVPRGVVLVDALRSMQAGRCSSASCVIAMRPVWTVSCRSDRVVEQPRGASEMRGIVYTGEGVEVTDELDVRARAQRGPGPHASGRGLPLRPFGDRRDHPVPGAGRARPRRRGVVEAVGDGARP